jgi:hypothetical protein
MQINPDRVTKFIAATGPRGACKTLFMTSHQAKQLVNNYVRKLLGMEERFVWSNYPVAFWYKCPATGQSVYLEARPLNMESFYTFDDELVRGWVYIDEIDQWFDRQEWQSATQKLMNKGLTQIRKKKLSIFCTLQDFGWLNGRAEFQTDIIAKCRESAFTPWGRKHGVDLGEVGFITLRDKSGIMTGYAYDETFKEYQTVFQGKRFWNYYDTNFIFDPIQSMTKYVIKKPEKEIVLPGARSSLDRMDSKGSLSLSEKSESDIEHLKSIINSTITEYQRTGNEVVKRRMLIAKVLDESGHLYSEGEVEDQLSRIPGFKPYHGSGNAFCKFEKVPELVPA